MLEGPIEVIQNELERKKMGEGIYKNKIFIYEINMIKIGVIPFSKIVHMPKQFFEARIKQLRNKKLWSTLSGVRFCQQKMRHGKMRLSYRRIQSY